MNITVVLGRTRDGFTANWVMLTAFHFIMIPDYGCFDLFIVDLLFSLGPRLSREIWKQNLLWFLCILPISKISETIMSWDFEASCLSEKECSNISDHSDNVGGGVGTWQISFICLVAQTRLDIPRPLNTQSHRHGWTYQGLWLTSHTDTAGHAKAFDYPVTQTWRDIPRPLITQSHRHSWKYQGLWLPSHTDMAGHTQAFDYPVTQTWLEIPRPLITQSHIHGWTYQGLWLLSHTDTAGHTKVFDYPVTQTRLGIPRPLITQSHRHGWTYQDLWLPSHTDTAGHTKAFDYPVTQTRLDIPRPLITQSHIHGWAYQGLWLPSHTDTAGHTKVFDYPVMGHWGSRQSVSGGRQTQTEDLSVHSRSRYPPAPPPPADDPLS